MIDQEKPPEALVQAAKAALENPNFKYRTVKGVANELGIDPSTARQAILHVSDLARLSRRSPDAHTLYTTKHYYYERASFWERLMTAFDMRIY